MYISQASVAFQLRRSPRVFTIIVSLILARAARRIGRYTPLYRRILVGFCRWQALNAGAESGWDFTTRWLDDSDEGYRLETIKAPAVSTEMAFDLHVRLKSWPFWCRNVAFAMALARFSHGFSRVFEASSNPGGPELPAA